MIKKVEVCFSLFLCLFIISACNNRAEISAKTGEIVEKKILTPNDINLTVKSETLTPEGATFLLNNASSEDVVFISEFELHRKESDGWHYLLPQDENIGWTAIANVIKAGSATEIVQPWETLYGKLGQGDYRFVKEIWVGEMEDMYYLAADFTIK